MTMLDQINEKEFPLNLDTLAQIQLGDSREWFPYLHTGHVNLLDFYLKGMTGELGEFANVMKKIERLEAQRTYIEENSPQDTDTLEKIAESLNALHIQAADEHTDILCYWLLVGTQMKHNLEASWRRNRHRNARRWG